MKPSKTNNPLWISHRGNCESAVENTRESFQAAVEAGFTALETDLRLTVDGHIVLVHDPTLERLTGDRRAVASFTRRDLEAMRLKNGETLLFLDRFADLFGDRAWTFDIKPETGEPTIRALAVWAERQGMKPTLIRQAKFLTWRQAHERLVRRLFPGARFYARKSECRRAGMAAFFGLPWLGRIRPGRTYALPPAFGSHPLYTRDIIDRYHRKNAAVVAFLPEIEDEARAAVAAGVDEILTNGGIIIG